MPKNDYSYWSGLDKNNVQEWFGRIYGGDNPERRQAIEIFGRTGPESILEIGPGCGRDYEIIKQIMPNTEYSAVDVSAAVVAGLKERFPEMNVNQGNLFNGLPFEDNSFDVVYARHVIEHMPYYEKPIKEMIRVAKNLVVVTMFRTFRKKDELSYHGGRNDNRYGLKKFEKFLAGLGFDYKLVGQENKENKKIMAIELIK